TVRRSGLNPRALTPPDDDPPAGATGAAAAGGAAGAGRGGGAGVAAEGGGAPAVGGASQAPAPAADAAHYDLLSALTIDGWLGDSYPDLLADRVDATLVIGSGAGSLGAAHIAARLGLESTGIAVPIVRRASEVTDPARETNPILVGRDNAHVETLVKIGRARLDRLSPGEGVVQVIPRAFGSTTATVVAGADAAGTDAAAMYLARRLPFVWDNRRGSVTLEHIKTSVADFFGARTGGGQAGLAIAAVSDIVRPLIDKPDKAEKPLESFGVKVFLEEKNPAFEQLLDARLKADLGGVAVKEESESITAAVPVFDDAFEIPWEVDDFRKKLAEALPRITAGSAVDLDARLSESPEMRRQIADETRRQLVAAGARDPQVRVRSAYKQGFTWMMEEVAPALKGKGVASVHVKIKEYAPDFTKKFRFYTLPTRWLHELYPIDEVFKRDLGLPTSSFTMELVDSPKDIYELEARNRAGAVVLRAAFSPKVVEREYLEKFPGWSRVEVTTGWMTLTVAGKPLVDERIATDPERFWDFYQGKVLTRIHDHVMKLTNNRPTADLQPFHRDLDVEVWMSEPDYRIGIDEEQVSSIEALHEDLYFVTLDFYAAIGRNQPGRPRLGAPGKIFPIMHGERRGQPGTARVHYAANAAPRARIEATYKEKGTEKPVTVTRDLTRVDVAEPEMLRAVVTTSAVRELEMDVAPANDREAARAADLIDMLGVLHKAGLYQTELSYANVGRLMVSLPLRDARPQRSIAFTGKTTPSAVRTSSEKPTLPLVTWDHVIGPDEAEDLIRKLAAFPTVTAYRAGRSYRGRDVSVMEMLLPTTSEQMSVTKMTALKPTIFITGRQHANEVSSTSHILKLAELLATDSKYTALLKKVNVILHPVENPDGAAMAYELQKLTPTHMLHAGRYSALGQDVGGGGALLPESQVRGRVWREWRPDIYLNPHGYPS
ncbi:MAG: M14 family zinc carboxypeptidase, partial [Vicinamibacterales bacterium]